MTNNEVTERLTKQWKECDEEIVALKVDIRTAHGDIRRLEAQIESIQSQIAALHVT